MIEKLKKYEAIVASGEIGAGTRNEVAVLLGRAANEIEAKDRQLEAASADAEAADAEIDSLRNKLASKDAEIARLREIVKELSECIYGNPCTGCSSYSCSFCKHRRKMNALVAKAREDVK